MTEPTKQPLMTTTQVAERFHKSLSTIRRWREDGVLTGIKIKGTWYFRTEDVEALTQDDQTGKE